MEAAVTAGATHLLVLLQLQVSVLLPAGLQDEAERFATRHGAALRVAVLTPGTLVVPHALAAGLLRASQGLPPLGTIVCGVEVLQTQAPAPPPAVAPVRPAPVAQQQQPVAQRHVEAAADVAAMLSVVLEIVREVLAPDQEIQPTAPLMDAGGTCVEQRCSAWALSVCPLA
jgi:hypothetical protein